MNQMDDLMQMVEAEMLEYSEGAYADHGSARDQLSRFAQLVAKKAVEAEKHRCSQLAISCSWEVVGAENALLVEALDEAIRNPPLD